MFFAETRMGWKKTAANQEYVGDPPADKEDARQILRDELDRIAKRMAASIGIGGRLAVPPLPHHRAYGSRTTAVRPG